MANQNKINTYVKYYTQILSEYGIELSTINTNTIKELIFAAYELDDLYDVGNTTQNALLNIRNKMLGLLTAEHLITHEEINLLFNAHLKESQADSNFPTYLEISGKALGVRLFSGYVADIAEVDKEIWFSPLLKKQNTYINQFLRLANDYLDYDKELERYNEEKQQVKSRDFIKSKSIMKVVMFIYYLKYNLFHFYLIIRILLLRFSQSNIRNYSLANNISSSVLRVGRMVYVKKEDSGR